MGPVRIVQIKSQNHQTYEALFPPFGAVLEALIECFSNAKTRVSMLSIYHDYIRQLVLLINHQMR
jgi:hypothetical protein